MEGIAGQKSLYERVDAWLARTPFLEFKHFSFWNSYRGAVEKMLASDAEIIKKPDIKRQGKKPAICRT
ncbi:hypothetical protein METHB2_780008 [Candidatus Methylobacter favarea]|uniref:Uncharacterized protein n=1 Tax=Candidatus Methylobacter favarea TaxID=2707345 RepID=A0A8S0WLI7_9GAMM|nr:hypothetical protein METHB2_780008 [Candidatus Methylobacter favarea]